MTTPVITVENLSKYYRLGVIGGGTLREDVNRWWALKRGKPDPYAKIGDESAQQPRGGQIWALQDVNLEVNKGEILGVIGRNGAGKSTLLKILSRITEPTSGRAIIKGRVGSLLEVGTGFHPELTGRENIYLNGAILGMRRAEVTRKLDEIVEFAEVAKFVDTPVKRYSSGMLVRLAFAVAAHLEPEVLIIDEVLAVGDAAFQKKCLGKMKDVSQHGRTVLFVSHNMQTISALTDRCVWLANGTCNSAGKTEDIIKRYLDDSAARDSRYFDSPSQRDPKVTRIEVLTSEPGGIHAFGKPLKFQFEINTPRPVKGAALSFQVMHGDTQPVAHMLILDSETPFLRKPGLFNLVCEVPDPRLYIGTYTLKVHLAESSTKEKLQTIDSACCFEIVKFGELREYYWERNTCLYVEKCNWIVSSRELPDECYS
jgi:lipopolysaccharide transport system ATP-binding protein